MHGGYQRDVDKTVLGGGIISQSVWGGFGGKITVLFEMIGSTLCKQRIGLFFATDVFVPRWLKQAWLSLQRSHGEADMFRWESSQACLDVHAVKWQRAATELIRTEKTASTAWTGLYVVHRYYSKVHTDANSIEYLSTSSDLSLKSTYNNCHYRYL